MQKHEREALGLARDILGPSARLDRHSKYSQIIFGDHAIKIAQRSGDMQCLVTVRRWANRIKRSFQ